jgi:hypothetical protein
MREITKFFRVALIAALVVVVGSTAAWAQCPASPNYVPDFSSNQNCLTLNGTPLPSVSGYPGFFPPAHTLVLPPGTTDPAQPAPAGVNEVLRLTTNTTFTSGSAWFNTAQAVAGPFSTTFTFQLSNSTTSPLNADGFAFVIQNQPNNPLNALDPDNGADGCSLGFGDAPSNHVCTSATGGVTNSVAIEFDTYQNNDIGDPNANHVAIQSCGTGANSVEASTCRIADNTLERLLDPRGHALTLADGYVHTVTITFSPSGTCSASACPGLLDVILDNNDLFPADSPNQPSGVAFDIASIGLTLTNGNAYVGFTAATGGDDDVQDILSWTFSPNSQSAAASTTTTGFINIEGGTANGGSDFTALMTPFANNNVTSATVSIKRILMDQDSCNDLVQKSFPFTQCIVYQNAGTENGNLVDKSVLYEVTCPDQTGGTCGSIADANFFAQFGTDFELLYSENPGLQALVSTIGPYLGGLKGAGPLPGSACTPYPNNTPALFTSNQIYAGYIANDPGGGTKKNSGGTGSCWVDTYFTFGELPPGIGITSPKFTTYKQSNTPGAASYTCSNPRTSQPGSSPTGPYLTVASCTQSQTPNQNNTQSCSASNGTPIVCTGQYDLSVKGLHKFTVRAVDSGGNLNVNVVLYTVR